MEPVVGESLARLGRVATALGPLASEVVFIGGSIAGLLHTDPPFEQTRATKDVDAVVASTSYTDTQTFLARLRARGFTQSPLRSPHLHRWYSPDGDVFDLMASGEHVGGSGSRWDSVALESSVEVVLDGGIVLRHASAPAFLGMKWAAFADRGASDPTASHDLEDIFALIGSRASLVSELQVAPVELRRMVAQQSLAMLADPRLPDILAAHCNNAQRPAAMMATVHAGLTAMAEG